jgi:hypothetical protein
MAPGPNFLFTSVFETDHGAGQGTDHSDSDYLLCAFVVRRNNGQPDVSTSTAPPPRSPIIATQRVILRHLD